MVSGSEGPIQGPEKRLLLSGQPQDMVDQVLPVIQAQSLNPCSYAPGCGAAVWRAVTVPAHLQTWSGRQHATALPCQSTLTVTSSRQACGEETRLCQVMLVSTPRALDMVCTCSSAPGEAQAELRVGRYPADTFPSRPSFIQGVMRGGLNSHESLCTQVFLIPHRL